MKNTFLYTLLFLILGQMNVLAQNSESQDNFDILIREEEGDLNNDGILDRVIICMDTVDQTVPLRLQIFLSQPNGRLKLVVSSTQIIEAMYPPEKGKGDDREEIPNLLIENGNLLLLGYMKGGTTAHEFKLRNGNFELIIVSRYTYDGKDTTTEAIFNLITGIKTEEDMLLGTDDISRRTEEKRWIRPLPKIQNFKFSDKDLY